MILVPPLLLGCPGKPMETSLSSGGVASRAKADDEASSTHVQGEVRTVATFSRVSESAAIKAHLGDNESLSLTIEDITASPWSVWSNKGGLVIAGVQAGQHTLWWDGGAAARPTTPKAQLGE